MVVKRLDIVVKRLDIAVKRLDIVVKRLGNDCGYHRLDILVDRRLDIVFKRHMTH